MGFLKGGNVLSIYEQIKNKYKLETNLKGIEYIDALEKEVLFLQAENRMLHSAVEEDDATKNSLLENLNIGNDKISELLEKLDRIRNEVI